MSKGLSSGAPNQNGRLITPQSSHMIRHLRQKQFQNAYKDQDKLREQYVRIVC